MKITVKETKEKFSELKSLLKTLGVKSKLYYSSGNNLRNFRLFLSSKNLDKLGNILNIVKISNFYKHCKPHIMFINIDLN